LRVVKRALHMGAVWLLLSVSLWAAGTACIYSTIQASGESHVSMRFSPQNGPSFDGIEQYYYKTASKGEKAKITGIVTAWTEERNRQVSATEWKADAAVDVYYVNGNVTDVMDLSLVAGGFPAASDKTGISIDDKTAIRLFGASTPVGLDITLDGKKYTVRGIFELPGGISAFGSDTGRGLAILSPPAASIGSANSMENKSIGVQGVEFIFPAGMSPDEAKNSAMQLAGEMGLGGSVYVKDFSAEDKVLSQFTRFPGWAMMAIAIFMLLQTTYSQTGMMLRIAWRRFRSRDISENTARNTMLRGLIWGSISLLAAAGVYLIVRPGFSLPPSYIPTQWSDVGFWPELFKKMMLDHVERNALPVLRPDAVTSSLTGLGIAFITASLGSIYFINTSLGKVLGRPVSSRLKSHPDEWSHPVAHWDASCYLLLLVSIAAPVLALKFTDLLGLRPVISGMTLTMQLIPIVMIAVELILRLWPSVFWPLRFSPALGLLKLIRKIPRIYIPWINKNIES